MRRALVTVPVLLLAVAGCGSSKKAVAPVSRPTTTAASVAPTQAAVTSVVAVKDLPDPCSLLTKTEISAALGATVIDGKAKVITGPLGGKSCYWSNDAVPITWFQIAVRSDASMTAEDAATLYDQTKTTFQGLEGWTDLSGVGDKAIIGKDRVEVLKGTVLLDITIGERDPAVAKTALTALSTGAAAKI